MPKPRPISGFPEWLPEWRMVELGWLDQIRAAFERYGFCSIETPSVEEVDILATKGEVDKEIYALRRLMAGDEEGGEARLALHFDLTVPFARYVAQHLNELVLPFKRYQIQKVWRGERPQEGRFREFYQCDIDVIDEGEVSLQFDAEMPAITYEILSGLGIRDLRLSINNRKVLEGFYRGLGIEDAVGVIRIMDRLDKVGREGIGEMLGERMGLDRPVVAACLDLAGVRAEGLGFIEDVRQFGVSSELLDQGLEELKFVMDSLRDVPAGACIADLSIARGLDYYTGTVYEGRLVNFPDYSSVCSGGRYDNLCGAFINRKLPGVGISIGLTRLFAKLLKENLLAPGPKCPTQVLVLYPSYSDRRTVDGIARTLRQRGIRAELYHEPRKLQAQLRYASRKGIRFVWFPPGDPQGRHEVKDLQTGAQCDADLASWLPR